MNPHSDPTENFQKPSKYEITKCVYHFSASNLTCNNNATYLLVGHHVFSYVCSEHLLQTTMLETRYGNPITVRNIIAEASQ